MPLRLLAAPALGHKTTRRFSVLDAAAANDAINVSFAAGHVIPGGGVQLVGARAELTVATDDLAFAERRAAIERRAIIEAADLETITCSWAPVELDTSSLNVQNRRQCPSTDNTER
jgi:hypothetical protein